MSLGAVGHFLVGAEHIFSGSPRHQGDQCEGLRVSLGCWAHGSHVSARSQGLKEAFGGTVAGDPVTVPGLHPPRSPWTSVLMDADHPSR